MDKLVTRVTVIRRDGSHHASRVYEKDGRKKSSTWARPLERRARRIEKAQVIFGQELRRRHDESNRRRRDGWLLEGPANMVDAGRKALKEARKAGMPFTLLPKP